MADRITRRDFLHAGITSSMTLGAALITSPDAAGADSSDAYQAWLSWNVGDKGSRSLVHAAILAANAHNTQPWLFCANEHRIDLGADETRNLGAMDPFRREMHISLGCAVQNLLLTAEARGKAPQLTIEGGTLGEPKTNARPQRVASIDLGPGQPVTSPLLAAIPRRHTNRAAYDPERPISAQLIAELAALSDQSSGARLMFLSDAKARADFAAAMVEATRDIIEDPIMIADSDAWFRATAAEIAVHRDGPTLDAAGLPRWITVLAKILPAPSPERAHRTWLEHTRDVQLPTASLFGIIEVKDLYDRQQAVQAGMLWQRLHLKATIANLAAQPLNQLPERVDRERQLGKPPHSAKVLTELVGDPAWKATFAFRVGWPTRSVGPSPRREINDVIQGTVC